jgi:biuret amidohydrolase
MQYESGPQGYWQGHNWDHTVSCSKKVLQACREKGYPIVHVLVAKDENGIMCHPYDVKDINGKPIYSVKGTRNGEIMDELKPIKDEIVVEKQRFSAFYQTNLDLILQGLKAEHLIMMGVFTDACFLTSVYDAFFRGYTISIVKDACTAGTEAAHKTSILDMANWIYGCSIFEATELTKAINGENYHAWFWEKANSMPYQLDNIGEMYDRLK